MIFPLSVLILLMRSLSVTVAEETTKPCEVMALEELPSKYATTIMMNIQFGDYPGHTTAIYETIDSNEEKSFMSVMQEENLKVENHTIPSLLTEELIWNPVLSGVKNFLHVSSFGADGFDGIECHADKLPTNGSFINWLFGWDGSHGFPSVTGMLHLGAEYTPGCPTVINGIEVNTYKGKWNISAWNALLDVKYYWSNLERWQSTSGRNRSVPVAAVVEGTATIDGLTEHLKMEMDYSNFVEFEMPPEFFMPKADLWCYGRGMNDKVPEIPSEISYTEEILLTWLNGEQQLLEVVIPRTVWLDYNKQITRTDYKPLNIGNSGDPFDGKNGFVSQIDDFATGLSYTVNMDLGNCSIDYLTNDETGTVIIHDGHIHMRNPFFTMNFDKFAFNGVHQDRSVDIDAYLRDHQPYGSMSEMPNETNVFFLSSSDFEVQDGANPERLVPTKLEIYPTEKFNDPFQKLVMNVYHFSKQSPDFSAYDISPCFMDTEMMHLMVRMGWSEAMDIENTRKLFNDEARFAITTWGKVTNIRVVNIQFDIDFTNQAFYLIWTVLDYPKNIDIELQDLPDAIRPLNEIKSNLQDAVNKGYFRVQVYTNDGKGGRVQSQAEAGSLIELGDRGGSYTHKAKGTYSSGSMAALGIIMLLLTVGGILALLVFVLKW